MEALYYMGSVGAPAQAGDSDIFKIPLIKILLGNTKWFSLMLLHASSFEPELSACADVGALSQRQYFRHFSKRWNQNSMFRFQLPLLTCIPTYGNIKKPLERKCSETL